MQLLLHFLLTIKNFIHLKSHVYLRHPTTLHLIITTITITIMIRKKLLKFNDYEDDNAGHADMIFICSIHYLHLNFSYQKKEFDSI